jgi:phosphatidyl-myo-inositol dimannoside synthase
LPVIIAAVPDVVYLIGGRGPYEENLRKLASELGVADHVVFLGFVSDACLVSLYSICDLFAMINRDTKMEGPEGFGMVFTEASASGKPVIGGRSGGTADSIVDGTTGYRVNPYDVDAVASQIMGVLTDKILADNLGKNGRKWVEQNFNWISRSDKLADINYYVCKNRNKRYSC